MFTGAVMSWWKTTPEFKSQIEDLLVKSGERIELKVKVSRDDLEVRWTKNGQTLHNGDRINIHQTGVTLTLWITNAKEEDDGRYTVTISSGADSASLSATVKVLEYDRHWRVINWGRNADIKHRLQDMTLRNPQAQHLRILLHGPVAAGKSSIINSINSIFQGRVMVGALAATAGHSFTRTYNTYEITDNQNRVLPFVFNDMMGLENNDDKGVHPDDIISAIEGHMREDYRFHRDCPLSRRDSSYNSSPALSDKVHCLVSVVPADRASNSLDEMVIRKMQMIRKHASDLNIPQVVFMTRVDLLCPLVKDNLQCIYSSKLIKQKMQSYKNVLGVPMNCIFPVKNYHEENTLNSDMDSLLLDALQNAVDFANDYVGRLTADTHPSATQPPVTHAEPSSTHTQQMERPTPRLERPTSRLERPTSRLERPTLQVETPEASEPSTCSENSGAGRSGGVHTEFLRNSEIDSSYGPENVARGNLMPVFTHTADRELDIEWRRMNWDTGSRNRMERELRELRLLIPDLKHLRILLHGPVGAGKSSFINSIDSVFQGQVSARALVATGAGVSFTKKYKTYPFINGNSGCLPFVVNDIMGLEKGNSDGVHPNDIISALKGHVKNNHKFNPVSPLSVGDHDYNPNPALSDRVHCLVSVVDTLTFMEDDVIAKMHVIREAASDMDIPQAVVMTKVDKACPLVKQDLRKTYVSKRIQQTMQECSDKLGVPMNCIFPVKNYHNETDLDQEMDCLTLTALKQIVHFAHEHVCFLKGNYDSPYH